MANPVGGIGPAAAALERASRALGAAAADRDGAAFGDLLARALGDVSQLQADAKDAIGAFLRGEPVELHQVMAATEEASLSLELLVEIRNKLSEAYRSVMNMQA